MPIQMNAQQQKTAVAWLSVGSNTALVLVKLLVGVLIGSVAVISEAIHSGVDLLASIIALVAVKSAGKPADKDHPFGHGKIENLSGTLEALLIFFAAGWIIYEAVGKLRHPGQGMDEVGWGVAVMGLSALVNLLVSQRLFAVGKATESIALQADAWHLRTDIYTSAGVMTGLALIWVGERLLPGVHLHWLDPVAAMIVALLIVRAAWRLTRDAARDLLDASLPGEEKAWICAYLGRLRPTVRGFHQLRTRKSGHMRFIECHLIVEAEMSVAEAHRISEVIECDLEDYFNDSHVTVHIEPCTGACSQICKDGCLLTEEEQEIVRAERR